MDLMPYISESDSGVEPLDLQNYSPTGVLLKEKTVSVDAWYKSQYGWRSIGEREAARANLQKAIRKNTNWASSRNIVTALDRVERSLTNPIVRPFLPTNDRIYSETRKTNNAGPWVVWPNGLRMNTAFDVASLTLNAGQLTDEEVRAIGEPMLRGSIPTKPHANLGVWFAELHDFRRLLTGVKPDKVTSKSSWGSSYLNWQFGWVPFVSDLKKAAESVLNSEDHVNQFLSDSMKLVPRTRVRTISADAEQFTGTLFPNKFDYRYAIKSSGNGTIRVGANTFSGYNTNPRTQSRVTRSWTERIKTYATFEYFAMDPDGALGRLPAYYQKARNLLGSSAVSAEGLYELAPWSWLVDWYVDIGGLLAYQESVASDSLAMRRSGTVYETIVKTHGHFDIESSDGLLHFGSHDCFEEKRSQTRVKGNPYSLTPSWAGLTAQQWFILGALGLTRAPGIPH
jgi:hypothetical protein